MATEPDASERPFPGREFLLAEAIAASRIRADRLPLLTRRANIVWVPDA